MALDSQLGIPVKHVSETAYYVAALRALESQRDDALFKDPYAETLCGPEGLALLDKIPHGRDGVWFMAVRTKVLDDFILEAIRDRHIGVVVNLATGLDTRPYRLSLPKDLKWIEVDFSPVVDAKTHALKAFEPQCVLERVGLNLVERELRQRFFRQVGAEGKKVLVLTEGLLNYLEESDVTHLAHDLKDLLHVDCWMMDQVVPQFLEWAKERWGSTLKDSDVRFKFSAQSGNQFFLSLGWNLERFVSYSEACEKFQRLPPDALFQSPLIREGLSQSGLLSLVPRREC